MSRIPTLFSRLLAVVSPRDYLWELVISSFAWLWPRIGWVWGVVFVGGLIVDPIKSFLTNGPSSLTDPSKWETWHLIVTYPYQAATVIIFAIVLTICSFLAHRSRGIAPSTNDKLEYGLKRVDRLNPDIYFSPYYVEVYLPRRDKRDGTDADAAARKVLHQATTRTGDSSRQEPLGICVFGRPTQGKTRFAWEAMRAELPKWMFVKWSPHGQLPFKFLARHRRGVVLWLDDLHKFAKDTLDAPKLNDQPRSFVDAGIQLRVVATCRDGDDETQARMYLGSLLERLTEVHLADISPDEANQLAGALTQKGVEVQQFDGTPGSLLLGVRRMRDQRYPALPGPAQQVLKAMKLLYSVGIYTYPETRVHPIAQVVFKIDTRDWRMARDKLAQEDFVRLTVSSNGEKFLEPIADVYLEQAVADYPPQNADSTIDWRQLQDILTQLRDAVGLNSLGVAYAEHPLGDRRANRQNAESCFREALRIYTREHTPTDWAMTQINLGNALRLQAELAIGPAQLNLLSQAIDAYRIALQIYTQEQAPFQWATIQINLGNAFRSQAKLAEDPAQMDLFSQATDAYHAALQIYTREQTPAQWAAIQNNLGATLSTQAELIEGPRRLDLLSQAISAYRAALQIRTQEQTPANWAMTQNNLGTALRNQSWLVEGSAQFTLLSQAISAYRAALQVYTQEQTPADWVRIQSYLADTLIAQVPLAEDSTRLNLLQQVADAYRAALQVYTQEQAPADWARIQLELAETLSVQAMLAEGLTQFNLLQQAADAYRAALQVYTQEQAPADWANIQNKLATIFATQATLVESSARLDLFSEAIRVFQALLQVYTREKAPDLWAMTQNNLAYTYFRMASLEDDANKRCTTLRKASQYVEDILLVFAQEKGSEYYLQATQLYQAIKEKMQEYGCLSKTKE